MNDDILTTAVKIAKIIDDGVDRDNALSRIAQVQAAINYVDDAWETISQIRYVDIRAEAMRRALDNQLTWHISKKEIMPELDLWLEKLMEETLAIPSIQERCINLRSIILFILPRLDDKETALSMVVNARNEFAQLENIIDRSKCLFTACEMLLQLNDLDEATATLELIQERISEIKPHVQQGLFLGLLAYEYWKMQDYMSAFECIGRVENREIQAIAYMQLVELLSNGGLFNDAESIVDQQEEKKQKNQGNLLINMGKNVFRSFSKNMNNIVFNLNKSFMFCNELDSEDSFDSDQSKSEPLKRPTWTNHLMVIKSVEKENDDVEQSESDSNDKEDHSEFKIVQENLIESYVQFVPSDDKDTDEDEDDGESWKDADDDDGESWKDADAADDGESWKESDDDDDGEEWKRSSEEDDDDNDDDVEDDDVDDDELDVDVDIDDDLDDDSRSDGGDKHDLISDFINNKMDQLPFPEKIRKLHELFLERVMNLNQNLNDVPKEKYFSLMETSQGILTFNQALPPKLLKRLLRKIFILLHMVKSKKKEIETLFPQDMEKVEEFTSRMEEIGFDDAWQEVISQGDYKFAVESSLNYYCYNHKKELFFGCEYLYSNR